MAPRLRTLVLAAFGLALASAPAAAEMYRCVGPDGGITFTSDPAACHGGLPERHAPTRDVQKVGPGTEDASPAPAAPRPQGARSSAASSDEAQAAAWKSKRANAERELAQVEHNAEELRELVSWCNRGGDLTLVHRSGMRENYSCDDAKSEFEKNSAHAAELRHYLDGGLEQECRQAGCLPGWVR